MRAQCTHHPEDLIGERADDAAVEKRCHLRPVAVLATMLDPVLVEEDGATVRPRCLRVPMLFSNSELERILF